MMTLASCSRYDGADDVSMPANAPA